MIWSASSMSLQLQHSYKYFWNSLQPTTNFYAHTFFINMRAETLATYNQWIEEFSRFCGGRLFCGGGLRKDFEIKAYEFIEHLKREGYAASTIRVAYAALRKFAKAFDAHLELTNLPPVEEKIPDYLSEEEVKKLIDGTLSLRDKAVIALLYDCALRVRELIELDVEDVYLSDITILVRGREDSRFQRLPVSEKTAKILEQYIKEYRLESGPLFPSPISRSGRIDGSTVYRTVRSWGEWILGKKVHPHMLRHTAAVVLRKRGVDMETIRDFLGLKTDATNRRYARLVPSELKKIPSRL